MTELRDAAGVTHTSSQDIYGLIKNYFSAIFTTQGVDQHALNSVLDTIPTTISEATRSTMSLPYTADEVFQALKSLSSDSSPGVDGMSVMFYSNYWNIVGPLVTTAVLDVLNNGCDSFLLNKTLITIIPKVKKPVQLTQYRPISLYNVLYKIVSKTIVLRIQPYLPMAHATPGKLPLRTVNPSVLNSEATTTIASSSSQSTWRAPPFGNLKLNTDATMNVSVGKYGLGAILRDSVGRVIAAMSKLMKGHVKPEEMEALAIA
uniref:RNase H type-1 domain-containing protein n=1 Tax=Cannabis sativa TaxID=3483 RepID=A0A803NJD1_CANSA